MRLSQIYYNYINVNVFLTPNQYRFKKQINEKLRTIYLNNYNFIIIN